MILCRRSVSAGLVLRTLLASTAMVASALPAAASRQVLQAEQFFLGLPGEREWRDFDDRTPDARQVELTFLSARNERECTLLITQQDVKLAWDVRLNDRRLGRLERMEQPLTLALAVPPGLLVNGNNRLAIVRPKESDDIILGPIAIDLRPLPEAIGEASLEIEVSDPVEGKPLPCRITITDTRNGLIPLFARPGQPIAVRTGVIYSGNGKARIGVPGGEHVIYAGRGFEYGIASRRVTVAPGERQTVALQIRREVPTPGLVAADSHIHTQTYSGHGDASIDERMLTIAGEGIEVAIATDHNHHTDYSGPAQKGGVSGEFASIIGNEVTTQVGHFNAFPIAPGRPLPDFRLRDWSRLLPNIRSSTGAQIVILNHPRDLHQGFTPFGSDRFNRVTGEFVDMPHFDCDAIEVVTSAALQSDYLQLYRDWFGLLNAGRRVFAVGASDVHDVSRMIVGQARTYVACDDHSVPGIDIDKLCESYRRGRLWVSLGLLTTLHVNESFGVGDLATDLAEQFDVAISVIGPSWTRADRVALYANGVLVRQEDIQSSQMVEKASLRWTIRRPAHDVALVAVASGPGVKAPYWEVPRPHQPVGRVRNPRVIGSTNPIWIDGDRDGAYSAAREYARRILNRTHGAAGSVVAELREFDEAVAAQCASLCDAAAHDIEGPEFKNALANATEATRRGFDAYLSARREQRDPPRIIAHE